jgi:hypothetical protein
MLMLAIIVSGCAQPLQNITSIKSENVNDIPKNLAIYPILSTPIGRSLNYYNQDLIRTGTDGGVSAFKYGDNVVISPPAESDLRVTAESKIMTALLSVEMSARGFSLSQLPVEIFQERSDNHDSDSDGRFFVTVDMLSDLKTKNGLKAIVIGDVFFRNERHQGHVEKKITFAHLKVIDVTTLAILGQVYFPYDSEGVELNQATACIAAQLAGLAGLPGADRADK